MIALNKTFLARGKRGIVSTANYQGRKVIIKESNPKADVNTIAHEAMMLQVVNKKGIGPLFIAFNDGILIREFVDGKEAMDWIQGATKLQIKKTLLDILKQCRTLDLLGVNKEEMTHPHKHILMQNNKPVFIDFERCKYTKKPKNITQVCQWITNREMNSLLSQKHINIPRDAMLAHAKTYKQNYSASAYGRIQEVIKNA